jgi:hypothetical protein
MSGHDDEIHVYEESGIEEGNRPVPFWFAIVALALLAFFGWYVVTHSSGVQPSATQFK